MENLIYYPGFEVANEDWLKFALLYLDKLQPIIPYAGDVDVSELSRRLANDTDLIHPHRPTYEEGDNATRDAIEQLEKVIQHPERYNRIFGDVGFVERWKDREHQTSTLYRDKYSGILEHFCEQNELGHRSNRGLRIPRDVVLLYMTILAQTIGDANAVSPITDYRNLDRFSIFTRRPAANDADTVDVAQAVFELKLPSDLSEIGLETIIRHRNRSGFRAKQRAFHQQFNSFMDNYDGDNTPQRFVEALGSSWREFSDAVLSVGTGIVPLGLGVWLLNQSGTASFSAVAKLVTGGLALTVGSIIVIRNTWTHTKTKRYTRKFLSDLQALSPTHTG